MKKILVPVDFSACSNAAVDMALQIAGKASSEIYFLHLHHDLQGQMHVPYREEDTYRKDHQNAELGLAKEGLSRLVARAEHLGIGASPLFVYNNGMEGIHDYVKPFGIDLVIMGSHGVSGIKETFLGSNTQRFIRHSPVPVLVVKRPPKENINSIVFASSFEENSVRSFEMTHILAGLWNAAITLLYINTPYHFKETHESIADMKRFMHQFPGVSYNLAIYDAYNEEQGIHRYAEENKIDMIALSTHGKKYFARLLSHGVAESIINHEEVPVLVVNTHAAEVAGKSAQKQKVVEEVGR